MINVSEKIIERTVDPIYDLFGIFPEKASKRWAERYKQIAGSLKDKPIEELDKLINDYEEKTQGIQKMITSIQNLNPFTPFSLAEERDKYLIAKRFSKEKKEFTERRKFISDFSDQVIRMFEEFLGIKYGTKPGIIIGNTHEYKELLKQEYAESNRTEESIDKEVFSDTFFGGFRPTYLVKIHKIFFSYSDFANLKIHQDPRITFAFAHELAHGLARNLGGDIPPEDYSSRKDIPLDELISQFIKGVISEGYADYVSMSSFKKNKLKFPNVIKFIKEHENNLAKGLEEPENKKLYENLKKIESFDDSKKKKILYAIYDKNLFYPLGYCYFDQQIPRGRPINDCLLNPPKSIEEMIIKLR